MQKSAWVWCLSPYEYRWAMRIHIPRAKTNSDVRVKSPTSAATPAAMVTQ